MSTKSYGAFTRNRYSGLNLIVSTKYSVLFDILRASETSSKNLQAFYSTYTI